MNDGGTSPSTVNDASGQAILAAVPLKAIRSDPVAPEGANGADRSTPVSMLQRRIAELELRLRERVEENIVLDNEVQCLQREGLVRNEYLASLQDDASRLPNVEWELGETKRQLEEVRSELEAFRNRQALILVDRIVVSAQRRKGLYRAGRFVTYRLVRTFRS
jgi:hypothetical protein